MDNIFENFYMNGGILRGRIEREEQVKNGEVLNSKVGDYTIDSCYTFDEGYETAIWKGNNRMIIVERYDTKEEMADGHNRWCEFCKENPKEVFSVQMGEVLKF